MSNNYFNFTIPYFCSQEGSDWNSFTTIVDDNVDYLMEKTYQLYWLVNPSKMPTIALEKSLKLLGIKFSVTDTPAIKKYKLRHFITSFANKGLKDTYLDLAESVTGIRGHFIYYVEGFVWGENAWADTEDSRWGGIASSSNFIILFNIKTAVEEEINHIESLLKEKNYRPAFYQIILVDDNLNYLRVI